MKNDKEPFSEVPKENQEEHSNETESKEEIIARLMELPTKDLRIRISAFKAAMAKWSAGYKARLENDPEFAKRHYELREKREAEERRAGEQK